MAFAGIWNVGGAGLDGGAALFRKAVLLGNG